MSQVSVPCPAVVRVTVSADAQHLCPFKDEVDYGTVRVSWSTSSGQTLELHALADLIRRNRRVEISHEQWTADLADAIRGASSVNDLLVVSEWTTAGTTVIVTVPVEGGEPE
jgi:NADPH-dependent 7-cyano-7-deazaguanine reductase QueF